MENSPSPPPRMYTRTRCLMEPAQGALYMYMYTQILYSLIPRPTPSFQRATLKHLKQAWRQGQQVLIWNEARSYQIIHTCITCTCTCTCNMQISISKSIEAHGFLSDLVYYFPEPPAHFRMRNFFFFYCTGLPVRTSPALPKVMLPSLCEPSRSRHLCPLQLALVLPSPLQVRQRSSQPTPAPSHRHPLFQRNLPNRPPPSRSREGREGPTRCLPPSRESTGRISKVRRLLRTSLQGYGDQLLGW